MANLTIDRDLFQRFRALCITKGTSATKEIEDFIKDELDKAGDTDA